MAIVNVSGMERSRPASRRTSRLGFSAVPAADAVIPLTLRSLIPGTSEVFFGSIQRCSGVVMAFPVLLGVCGGWAGRFRRPGVVR